MLSGRRLDLLDPSPDDIDIEDIAHGLARVARWNGQTRGTHAFSVAQHAVVVLDVTMALGRDLPRTVQLAALLHDAPEFVIGDLISPFKAAIGLDYKAFEHRLLAAIHTRFSLPYPLGKSVQATLKLADRVAAYYEAVGLAGFEREEAELYFGPLPQLDEALRLDLARLEPLGVGDAQEAFLGRFRCLTADAG